ncbi:hypothetical protein MVEN_02554700 [Mycena venus]|uniref:F-box domain-containing protein n=1 Tax=Mycena venus TaxID=2733690 RepID=A0A8H6U4Z7_9AGAR|nr:hypothetical protein MVEN_02554700 [Mycena venus]
MEFVTLLPAEVWDTVFTHLHLHELFSICATCRSFRSLALHSLQRHKALQSRYFRLGHDCDYNTFWYPLLLTLLRDPVAAHYVEDLEVEYANRNLVDELAGTETPWTTLPEDETLIRDEVEVEKWIPDTEKGAFLDKLLAGDEHAMVTLVVLRLPNLRQLSLPTQCFGGLDFDHLMPIVARIAQAASKAEDGAGGTTLPLSKLERLNGNVYNGYCGVDFEGIAPLMALPSVRILSTPWCQEEGFDWPPTLPKSHVRQIDIPDGTVPREAIVRLARGIRGPCVIRQEWGFCRYWEEPEHDWDILEIPFEDAREEEWIVGFKTDDDYKLKLFQGFVV